MEGADEQLVAESGAVTKQTADTLMAGERIVEAIDIADRERALFRAYYDECAESPHPENIPPPARNPLLAALDLSPEEHVLRTVEKVRAAELYDALLVLPFGKVISMIEYLNEWALRVSLRTIAIYLLELTCYLFAGVEYCSGLPNHVLPSQDASSSSCCYSHHAHRSRTTSNTTSRGFAAAKG